MSATGLQDDVVRIDGAEPLLASTIEALQAVCDRIEDGRGAGLTTISVSGVPAAGWTRELSVGLISKWERALRRWERLSTPTAVVAHGDCGGPALDALLATDFRIAKPGTRLFVTVDGDATWPGMALYRLARQSGAGVIRRAALLGEPLGAERAHSLGLLDEVADDPGPALLGLAALTEGFAGKELAIRRQLLSDALHTSFEDALGSHLAACDRALRRGAAS